MRKRITELADKYGLTGLKRVIYYIVAPIIYGLAFVIGYAKEVIKFSKETV